MAHASALLGWTSTIPWHATCAATVPILGLLQSSLTQQTCPSARFSTSTSPPQLACESPISACPLHCSTSTVSTTAGSLRGKHSAISAAVAHVFGSNIHSFLGQRAGQSWKLFSGRGQVDSFRPFSATPATEDNDAEEPTAPALPGGVKHYSQRHVLHKVQHALHILQHGNVLTLRQMLREKSETSFHITYAELIHMARLSGAAPTQAEAEELAEALGRSGVVMRYRNIVYLRPDEVADMVIKALPDTQLEAEAKVQAIDAELDAMKGKIEHLDKAASRWARVWLWGGCSLLALQLAVFVRLTWWELSWDVMEPFGYVIGLANTLIGYIYFMVFRNNLDYKPFEDYWKNRTKSKAAIEQKLDLERYQELLKLRARYVQHREAIAADMKKPAIAAS